MRKAKDNAAIAWTAVISAELRKRAEYCDVVSHSCRLRKDRPDRWCDACVMDEAGTLLQHVSDADAPGRARTHG